MPLLRYTAMINGFDSLVITKLDVLDEFDEIPVCVGYRIGGQEVCDMPPTVAEIEKIEPVYECLPGWSTSTFGISNLRRAAGEGQGVPRVSGSAHGRGSRLHFHRPGAQSDHRAPRLALRKTDRVGGAVPFSSATADPAYGKRIPRISTITITIKGGRLFMEINTRRRYFNKFATMMAAVTGARILFAQQPPQPGPRQQPPLPEIAPRNNHTNNGIYYFSGTGSNDGYPRDDHVLVTDPFEKHVTRTMDALKKSRRARRLHHG